VTVCGCRILGTTDSVVDFGRIDLSSVAKVRTSHQLFMTIIVYILTAGLAACLPATFLFSLHFGRLSVTEYAHILKFQLAFQSSH